MKVSSRAVALLLLGSFCPLDVVRGDDLHELFTKEKNIVPGSIPNNGITTAEVQLTICSNGDGGNCPLNVAILLDRSSTMGEDISHFNGAVEAAETLVMNYLLGNPEDHSALITVSSTADVEKDLDNDHQHTLNKIAALQQPEGTTPLSSGVDEAQQVLEGCNQQDCQKAIPVMVILSDGIATSGSPIPNAQAAKDAGTIIFTLLFGNDQDGASNMMAMANPYSDDFGGLGVEVDYQHTSLQELLDNFAKLANIIAWDVELTEIVHPDFTISGTSPNVVPNGNTITWKLTDLAPGIDASTPLYLQDCIEVSFEIATETCGDDKPIDEEGSKLTYMSCEEETEFDVQGEDVDVTCNSPPVCNAGGPYVVECTGGLTNVALDGSASTDPDLDDVLSYEWSTNCPGGSLLDDDNAEQPTLQVDTSSLDDSCPIDCTVFLKVSDGKLEDECEATVTVEDTTPPDITCPDDVEVTCGESTDPNETGTPNAIDACDSDPQIVWADVVQQPACEADQAHEIITRTWTVTDDCGNVSECEQTIEVLKITASLDVKPGSCPNSFNLKQKGQGFLPVALLGTQNFDVSSVDLTTVKLSRPNCVVGAVASNEGPPGPHAVIEDVATPFDGDLCDCHTLTGDGIDDLSMKFKSNIVVGTLELEDLEGGSHVEVCLSGVLSETECGFLACDCLRLVPPN